MCNVCLSLFYRAAYRYMMPVSLLSSLNDHHFNRRILDHDRYSFLTAVDQSINVETANEWGTSLSSGKVLASQKHHNPKLSRSVIRYRSSDSWAGFINPSRLITAQFLGWTLSVQYILYYLTAENIHKYRRMHIIALAMHTFDPHHPITMYYKLNLFEVRAKG